MSINDDRGCLEGETDRGRYRPRGREVRMTRELVSRVVLYTAGALVATALLVIGFGIQGEPDVSTLLNGADALALVGAHDKAIVQCLKVLERDPGNLRAHLLIAFCRDRCGDYDGAIESYKGALGCKPAPELCLEIELSVADLLRRAQ